MMKGQLSIREEGLMLSFVIHSEKAQRERERELEAEGLMRVLMIEAW